MNYSRVIDEIFSQFNGPKFKVKLWDGQEFCYGSGADTTFTLIIKNPLTVKRLLSEGSLGFGESYMEGNLQIEGDIEAYLRLRHQFKSVRRSLRLTLARFVSMVHVPRVRDKQIAYHYDVGNNFFEMLLDKETMSYSAGRYENKSENFATAQLNKLKLICDWLDLPAESSVLDLGSGWGGFAKYAVKNFNWFVTGYTLSHTQLEYSNKLREDNSLRERMSFEYRDMITNLPDTKFDGVVMIESIEHVGQKQLASFFQGVKQVLKPDGLFIIQTTGGHKSHRLDRWTQKYVFPGGYLPTKDELISAATLAGFLVEEFRDDTPDYINTMSTWIQNLKNHRNEIENEFGKPFYRLWELWMHGAKVNFEIGAMNLFRLRLRCPK
jgi:cyclopropane-fatty-acyl-phospholipid synthase